jgi:hypothetical protein
VIEAIKRPARSPLAKEINDPLELAPRRRQAIFGGFAARRPTPFQHTHSLQTPQPFGKKRARHVGKAALELIEVINVCEKMPWRPGVPSPTWRSLLRNHLPDLVRRLTCL